MKKKLKEEKESLFRLSSKPKEIKRERHRGERSKKKKKNVCRWAAAEEESL